jgi:hypothetical protein
MLSPPNGLDQSSAIAGREEIELWELMSGLFPVRLGSQENLAHETDGAELQTLIVKGSAYSALTCESARRLQ